MKTSEQLKGTIRSMAEKQNLRAQEVLQMYLFERFLEKLAVSRFKENFILKGGLEGIMYKARTRSKATQAAEASAKSRMTSWRWERGELG